MWHKVNFQNSSTGLNSDFSFSYTRYDIKAKKRAVFSAIYPLLREEPTD